MAHRTVRSIQHLDDLQPDPHNANRGTTRGRRALTDSIKSYGAGRSILADCQGTVIAGNKTLDEAKALGLAMRVVDTTGDELVVVRRTDLDLATDTRARQLAIADNRVNELNLEWNSTLLKGLAENGVELGPFWTPRELEQLVGPPSRQGLIPDDAVVPIRETSIQRGELFALGTHRLLCGDATNADDVRRVLGPERPDLMVTDPPYGHEYDATFRPKAGLSGRYAVGPVLNDDRVDWGDAFAHFLGDAAYVWHGGLHAGEVGASLQRCGFDLRAQIVWVKPHFVLSRGDFHWQHEPAWYAVRRGRRSHWSGDRTQSTVWTVPNLNPFGGGHDAENPVTGHSTQKPVALFERAMLCNSAPGDGVFDPFLGSGTTLIAAHKTARRCFALELDPRYVQVAFDRWTAYTGQVAARITHDLEARG
jgi:DNA modification methylase